MKLNSQTLDSQTLDSQTLDFQNSDVRNFFNENIAPNAKFLEDAVSIGNPTKAWGYLKKFEEQFKSLETIFPTATKDIKIIQEKQADLEKEIEELKNWQIIEKERSKNVKSSTLSVINDSKPIGIVRKSEQQNCAYCSLLQAISNSPNLRNRFMTDHSPYRGFYEEYAASQSSGKKVSDIDVNDVRKLTSTNDHKHQEDTGHELGKMLELVTPKGEIYSYDHNGCFYTKYEDTLSLHYQGINKFNETFQDSLAYVGGKTPPKSVVIQCDENSTGDIPTHIPSGKTGYELTGCVIHFGDTRGGHFVTLQRKVNGWYLIDDAHVERKTDREAQNLLKQGHLYFYEESGQAPVTRPALAKLSSYLQIPSWSTAAIGMICLAGAAYLGMS